MRREGWEKILAEAVERARREPFVWGTHDCCMWVCNVVREIDGRDPAAWFRGRYRTKRHAYALLRKFAGGGVAETWAKIARELGFAEVPPLSAQRADVVLVRTPLGDALGLCIGGKIACAGPNGLDFFPLTHPAVLRAWRI